MAKVEKNAGFPIVAYNFYSDPYTKGGVIVL